MRVRDVLKPPGLFGSPIRYLCPIVSVAIGIAIYTNFLFSVMLYRGLDSQVEPMGHYADPIHEPDNTTGRPTQTDNQNRLSPLLNADYLNHLQTLSSIPKIAHVMFPNATTLPLHVEKIKLLQHNIVGELQQPYNSDWVLKLYDDDAVHEIIRRAAENGLIPKEEEILLRRAHIVEQTDLARVLLMYTEGGLYLDADRIVNIPLAEVIGDHSQTKLLLPTYYDINFMQDAMCTAPHNRLFSTVLQQMTERRLRGGPGQTPLPRRDGWLSKLDLFSLGPALYRTVVSQVVFDNQPKIDMQQARAALDTTELIRTKKDEWCDGMFVRPFEGCKGIGREQLYKLYGLGRWGPTVAKRWDNNDAKEKQQVTASKAKTPPPKNSDSTVTKLANKIVVGLMVSAKDRYYDALQAQADTWLNPVPNERVFVVGPEDASGSRPNLPRFVPSPCVDRNLWCKRLQQVSEAHRLLQTGIQFDWLLSGNEDWYVNVVPFLETFQDKNPNDPIVYASLGCAQHWEYHEHSKGGTLPKPDGFREQQQCNGLSQKGGICGGSGIVFSRSAVEVLMQDGESALFNRTRALPFDWENFPQDDNVLSCVIYDFDGQVRHELHPWSGGERSSRVIRNCKDCSITSVHAVKLDDYSAADILRKVHDLIHKI